MDSLVTFQNLREWLNYSHVGKIIAFLNKHRIAHWIENGKPVTTLEAINLKLIHNEEKEEIEF
jgi:hypothetical protein|tara:strand:+ start:3298 stop:3486 length:189 start_codon:yes stop_codon:yes gene_type:complete